MLICIPKSMCSWDFQIRGGSAPAELAFNFLTEQGAILLGDHSFSVRKHGWLSGHWSLERAGEISADAQKPQAMFRSFRVRSGDTLLTVEAQSAFTRCYNILTGEVIVGTIRPAHAFTRRAFIECDASVPELTQLFAFWLAALTWRRAASNNGGGG